MGAHGGGSVPQLAACGKPAHFARSRKTSIIYHSTCQGGCHGTRILPETDPFEPPLGDHPRQRENSMNSSSKTNRIILWAIAAVLVIAGIGLVVSSLPDRDNTTETPLAVASPQADPTVEETGQSGPADTTPLPTALATAQTEATIPTPTPTPTQPVLRVALPNPLPPETPGWYPGLDSTAAGRTSRHRYPSRPTCGSTPIPLATR